MTKLPLQNNRPLWATLFLFTMLLGSFTLTAYSAAQLAPKTQAGIVPKLAADNIAVQIAHRSEKNPTSLVIPSINLSAQFEPLGLNTDRTIQVPKNDMNVGWFIYGAKPGDNGPLVIVGHLDSARGPAIFADLAKVKPGDVVQIQLANSSIVKYKIESLSKFSQNNFPTDLVYGPLGYSGIRLITCSGTYDKKVGHYSDNLIVFGKKI